MTKKEFKGIENPVMQFISQKSIDRAEAAEEAAERPEARPAPVRYRRREPKSRRLQLLIKPSLYARIVAKADADDNSINDTVHSLLEAALTAAEEAEAAAEGKGKR